MDRRLLAIALLSPLLALAVIRSLGEIADACVLDRFSTAGREALLDQYAGLVLAPSAWLLVFVCNACLCVALLCTAPSTVVAAHRAMPRWINYVTVWRVAVAQATYLVAQFLTVALKSALADKTCHDRPNSVSGHAVFHIMHCFALGYIRVVQHRQFASAKVSATGAPRAEAPVAVLLLPLDAAGMCACANESRKQQQQHQQQAIDRSDASAAVTSPSPLHYSPLPPRLHSFLFSASFAFHVIMASGSMFHTYAFGFHSARQACVYLY